jgi:hypothetical protein
VAENKNYKATITFGGLIGSSFKAATSGVDKALAKVRKEYKGVRDEMAGLRAQIRAGTGDVEAHKRRLGELEKQADHLKGRMASLGALTGGQMGTAFRTLSGQVKTLGLTFAALATGATFAGIKLLGDAMRSGDEIGETAQYLGLTTDALQKFRYAASVAGIDSAEFDGMLTKLTVNLSEAGEEGSAMAKVLQEIGMSYQMLANIPADDRLGVFIDRVKGIKAINPALANRILRDAIGKTGIKANLLVDGGSQGLMDLGKQAEMLNLIRKQAALQAASKADDAWRNLSESVKSLGFAIGDQLLPVFTEWANELTKWTSSEGYTAFKDFGRDAAAWFITHKEDIKGFFVALKNGVVEAANALVSFKEAVGSWKAVMGIGLAIYMLPTIAAFGSLAVSIGQLVPMLYSGAAATLAFIGPWGWAVLAIGAATMAVVTFRKEIAQAWRDMSQWASSTWLGKAYSEFKGTSEAQAERKERSNGSGPGAWMAKAGEFLGLPAFSIPTPPSLRDGINSTTTVQSISKPAGGTSVGTVNINVTQQPGQSGEDMARELYRILKGDRLSGVGLHD